MMKRAKPLGNLGPYVNGALNDSSFIEHDAGGDVAMLDRLVCSKEMESVWKEVNSLSKDDYFPFEFLQFALALPRLWKLMSKVPTAEAKKTLKEVEHTARLLGRQLRAHRPEFLLFSVGRTDLESLACDVLAKTGRADTAKLFRDLSYNESMDSNTSAIPDLPVVLDELADRLKVGRSRKRPFGQRPTKPGAKNAERTYCVKELVAFVAEGALDQISFDSVARTVNAILDERDPLTSDYVARLIRR